MLRSQRYSRTEASTSVVTTEEMRSQLRIDHTEDDTDLDDMVTEARREAEIVKLGDRSLINATCIDRFDTFDDEMELHWGPVVSVTSVQYVDTDGTTQTLSTDTYELGQKNGMGIIRLKYGQSWPVLRSHSDVITITYVAGYGETAASVPLGIRRWIKARAAWQYENRDGEEFPFNMDVLLAPYRTSRVFAGA